MEEVIIKENEIRQELVNIINNSKLPALILEPMLKDLYQQILQEKERQLQEALQEKEKREQEKEKNKKKEVKENGQD